MNANPRSIKRRQQSAASHDLRAAGCTCQPTIVEVPRSMWPEGARYGFYVEHRQGCVLGDQMAEMNNLGHLPTMRVTSPGCAR